MVLRRYLIDSIPEGIVASRIDHLEKCVVSVEPEMVAVKEGIDYYIEVVEAIDDTTEDVRYEAIPADVYYGLKEDSLGTLSAARYHIEEEEGSYRIDVYNEGNDGISILEIEFDDYKDFYLFAPPPWAVKDITFDKDYSDVALACRHAGSDWAPGWAL